MQTLQRLVSVLGATRGADVRWVSATGIVLRMPGAPVWTVVVEGIQDAPETVRALIARWVRSEPVEVLYVGGPAALRQETTGSVRTLQIDEAGELWQSGDGSPLLPVLGELPRRAAPPPPVPRAAPAAWGPRSGWDAHRPLFTPILSAALLLVFVAQIGLRDMVGPTADVRLGAIVAEPASLWERPWSLLSYAMLHGSATHLLFNGFALWMTGSFLERLIGRGRTLLLYVVGALGGGLAIALFGEGVHLGASGALWGLMVGSFALIWRARGLPPMARQAMLQGMGQNLILNLLLSFMPGISLAGHLGGGIAGGLFVLSGLPLVGLGERMPRAMVVASWAAALALGLSTVAAAVYGFVLN